MFNNLRFMMLALTGALAFGLIVTLYISKTKLEKAEFELAISKSEIETLNSNIAEMENLARVVSVALEDAKEKQTSAQETIENSRKRLREVTSDVTECIDSLHGDGVSAILLLKSSDTDPN